MGLEESAKKTKDLQEQWEEVKENPIAKHSLWEEQEEDGNKKSLGLPFMKNRTADNSKGRKGPRDSSWENIIISLAKKTNKPKLMAN